MRASATPSSLVSTARHCVAPQRPKTRATTFARPAVTPKSVLAGPDHSPECTREWTAISSALGHGGSPLLVGLLGGSLFPVTGMLPEYRVYEKVAGRPLSHVTGSTPNSYVRFPCNRMLNMLSSFFLFFLERSNNTRWLDNRSLKAETAMKRKRNGLNPQPGLM